MRGQISGMLAMFAVLILLCGCVTDYREDAVERSREYLLENMEGLSVLQQNYIRYNDPVIQNQVLFESVIPEFVPDGHLTTRHERNVYKAPNRDQMIRAITWKIPGMDGDVMVLGRSLRDYRFWEIDRIVVRNAAAESSAGEIIQKKAMLYATTLLPELTGRIRLRVRFSVPEVYTSLFLFDDEKAKTGQEDWMDFLKQAARKEPIQVSAVWLDPDTGTRIVVAGVSADESLSGWKPKKVYELQEEDAKIYLGTKYIIPKK